MRNFSALRPSLFRPKASSSNVLRKNKISKSLSAAPALKAPFEPQQPQPESSFHRTPSESLPAINFDDTESAFKHMTNWELFRGWSVLSLCGVSPLVKNSEQLLKLSYSVLPHFLVNAAIKKSFFGHFCGGETDLEVSATAQKLLRAGVEPVLMYSCEGSTARSESGADSDETNWRRDSLRNTFKQLDTVQRIIPGGMSPIKPASLCNLEVLEELTELISNCSLQKRYSLSSATTNSDAIVRQTLAKNQIFATFSHEKQNFVLNFMNHMLNLVTDESKLSEMVPKSLPLLSNMFDIGMYAENLNQHVLIDAEEFSMQPAIDLVSFHLMNYFNRNGRVVFSTTFQCYLRNTSKNLSIFLKSSIDLGFHVGVKLVRGAYMVLEAEKAAKKGIPSPVHPGIELTHECYNSNCEAVLKHLNEFDSRAFLMVASHNKKSAVKVLETMNNMRMSPEIRRNVRFAQLQGMADNLSFMLAKQDLNVHKYVIYGPVKEVLPYLVRRAQENSSVLGAAKHEKKLMIKELKRRILG